MTVPLAEQIAWVSHHVDALNSGHSTSPNISIELSAMRSVLATLEAQPAMLAALKGLLETVDRVLFNKPTREDYAKIEAAHKLIRDIAALRSPPQEGK